MEKRPGITVKEIETLADITPDPDNANDGTEYGTGLIEQSVGDYGFGRPILVDRNGVTIGGAKTLEAVAARLGTDVEVIVVPTTGRKLIVHQRIDLDMASDPRAKELAIMDNLTAYKNLSWNEPRLLRMEEDGVNLAHLFPEKDLEKMRERVEQTAANGGGPEEDQGELFEKAKEEPDYERRAGDIANPITKPGEVIILGRHRLHCADSTREEDVARLMAGKLGDAVFTDPPYAIYGSSSGLSSSVVDDRMVRPFFRSILEASRRITKDFAHIYICCDWRSYASWWEEARGVSLTPKNLIVWDKNAYGMGSMYANCHELVVFFSNRPRSVTMRGKTSGERMVLDSNIWRISRVQSGGEGRLHNAQKPVPLVARALKNSTDEGGIVVDLFLGSGTTLIAAEESGRICYGMEQDPKFCDVIRKRWEELTGGTAVVEISGGVVADGGK